MSNIGIKGLVVKNVDEIRDLVTMFIKSSLNIRQGITDGDDPETCMLSLIRDTFLCNMLLRYVGMMTLISQDQKWVKIDNQLMDYIQNYYSNEKFKNKLITLYEHFRNIYENSNRNYDYCRFLDKMINRGETSKKGEEIKKIIRTTENRIFNMLNVNPIVTIHRRYFKTVSPSFETNNDKVVVSLTKSNYLELLDNIDDPSVTHMIEDQYTSRTDCIITDFSKLLVSRHILAKESGQETYFKYINSVKNDNSDAIKDLLIDLNTKLNKKVRNDITPIYNSYRQTMRSSITKKPTDSIESENRMRSSDIVKYVRNKRCNVKFEPKNVFYVLFCMLEKYFNIKMSKISEKTWRDNVIVYSLTDSKTNKVLGRLFMDVTYDVNKKITDPISIRLCDKMLINTSDASLSEIAFLANYQTTKCMTYNDVVLLFREFGYVVNNVCYESRVGLINYDEEFSNYVPSLMECIAWDRDTVAAIAKDEDRSVVDHILMAREIDLSFNIKLKCANAKFDHLIHNSEPLLKILTDAVSSKGHAKEEIIETYKGVYEEAFKPVGDVFLADSVKIDPHVIVQEINGSQGVLYSNLINEIFAYATFWAIKNSAKININREKIDGVGEFRRIVLNNGVDNYRDLIRSFLKKMDVKCFSLYMKNVIKTDSVDDYVTEDVNYFDERYNPDGDEDQDGIIQINRSEAY
jgi:hypothetical protein